MRHARDMTAAITLGALALGAVLFAQLSAQTTNTLLAIAIMMAATVAALWYWSRSHQHTGAVRADTVASAVKGRAETYTDNYYVPKVSKLRFLSHNRPLMEVAMDLRFVRIYDKARYGDLLVMLDRFQKVYMYILGERYPPKSYVPTLIDLRDGVHEVLYSLIFAIPETFRHTYGFEPRPVIDRSIDRFTGVSRKMLETVRNFSRDRVPYFPSIAPRPYEPARADRLP